jgi:hypothetical protein
MNLTLMKMLPQIILLFLIAAPLTIKAQDRSPSSAKPESVTALCNEELFENADASFRMRNWRKTWFKAEQELKEVVRLCADTAGGYQAEEHLKIVQEELAERDRRIAVFYLDKFSDGKGGKQGALGRLKNIVERYPNYSKLDQVLFLLGQNVSADSLDEAARYYQRLMKDFPGSQYVAGASLALSAIDVMRIKGP